MSTSRRLKGRILFTSAVIKETVVTFCSDLAAVVVATTTAAPVVVASHHRDIFHHRAAVPLQAVPVVVNRCGGSVYIIQRTSVVSIGVCATQATRWPTS